MKNALLMIIFLATIAVSAVAAPVITGTTVWTDTIFTGPFTVSAVIHDASFALTDTTLRYLFNPPADDNPLYWGDFTTPDSTHGDTVYFHIPAVPMGLETPVKIGYAVYARNEGYEETIDPSSGYRSFINTRYSPRFAAVSLLQDTFYSGPLVVKANITTLYGDSVAGDYLYSDLLGGANYPRDSVGADGAYYYAIPRHPGSSQTPVKTFWYLAAADTMGNTASFPLKRDTLNHFVFIDPKPSNPHLLLNTAQTGPFPVWVNYKAEGAVANDSLWIDNGAGPEPFPRDSIGTVDPTKYYYSIPLQNVPVIVPISVRWFLKATDAASGNYTYVPDTALTVPYSFYIYDRTPPALSGVSQLENTLSPGARAVYATARDTSGIYQIRLYYRAKPGDDTSWQYLPMFATGAPNQYKATLPLIGDGTLVQYYVAAVDGAQDENANLLRNTALFPAGGPLTPWQFFVGSHPYRLLLVNDELPANAYEPFYTASLDTTGVLYGYWDNRKAGVLPGLHNFNTLLWFTGDDSLATLTQPDRDSLAAFLDRGGRLLLSSKNLGQNIGDTSVLMSAYLRVQLSGTNVNLAYVNLPGRDAMPLSYGLADTLRLTAVGTAGNYRSVDRFIPLSGADSVYTFKTIGGCGVVRCSTATYKTVFSSLPLECIGTQTAHNVSRTYFIARCLRYFGIAAFYKVEGERPAAVMPDLQLSPAFPNPFRGSTMISYQLPAPGRASLKVYNIAGQLVKTLADRQMLAGRHSVQWNGCDDAGNAVSSGVYFYQLTAEGRKVQDRMMVVR